MRRESAERPDGVAAVERALGVLNAFDREIESLSLTEIAASTGLYKSTVLRLLASLQRHFFVLRLPDGRYQLGPTLSRLGSRFERSLKLEKYVAPVLESIAKKTGETTALYSRHGDSRLCLLRVESPQSVRHHVYVGELRPLTNSASGKVLVQFERGAREASPKALRSLPAMVVGGQEAGVAGIAMPIFGIGDKLIGAISVSGPLSRFEKVRVRRISDLLVSAAVELSTLFGADPDLFEPLARRTRASR